VRFSKGRFIAVISICGIFMEERRNGKFFSNQPLSHQNLSEESLIVIFDNLVIIHSDTSLVIIAPARSGLVEKINFHLFLLASRLIT
jgi:hypothetical protein